MVPTQVAVANERLLSLQVTEQDLLVLFEDFVDAIVFFFFYLERQTLSAVVYIFALPR